MRAKNITDLLRQGDRVAVSNITGREAARVTEVSQRYAGNIVGGWALGKGGEAIPVEQHSTIPVFSDYVELLERLPADRHPNKIIIYSPPEAVYGEVKNVVKASGNVETIFIITENVSIEVSAKIHTLCLAENIDVLGCNTLGADQRHGAGPHRRGGWRCTERDVPPRQRHDHLQQRKHGQHHGFLSLRGRDRHAAGHLDRQGPAHPHAASGPAGTGSLRRTDEVIVLYIEPGGLYEQSQSGGCKR